MLDVKYIREFKINVPFYFILNILLIMRNSLQGMGRKIVPLTASFTELAGKFIAAFILAPTLGYLGVCLIEPITWIATAVIVACGFISAYRKEKNNSRDTRLNKLTGNKYNINKGFVAN